MCATVHMLQYITPQPHIITARIHRTTVHCLFHPLTAPIHSNTQGGTESIILAIKAHRDYYLQQHGITRPEIICCVSAHAAVDKVKYPRTHDLNGPNQ